MSKVYNPPRGREGACVERVKAWEKKTPAARLAKSEKPKNELSFFEKKVTLTRAQFTLSQLRARRSCAMANYADNFADQVYKVRAIPSSLRTGMYNA
jgi:hypothetical protein